MKIQRAIDELRDLFAGFDHEDPDVQDGIIAVAMGIKALKAVEKMKGHISDMKAYIAEIENTTPGEDEDIEPTVYMKIYCGYANKEKNWCNYRNAPITNCWGCCYNKDVWDSGKFRVFTSPESE